MTGKFKKNLFCSIISETKKEQNLQIFFHSAQLRTLVVAELNIWELVLCLGFFRESKVPEDCSVSKLFLIIPNKLTVSIATFQSQQIEAEWTSLFSGQWHSCSHAQEACNAASAELDHLVERKALFILQGQQRIKKSERLKGCAKNVLLAHSVF